MKRVYVAGPLNGQAIQYVKNMHVMIDYADQIRRMGYSVFIPCLDVLVGLVFGNYEYADYADNNMAWVEVSDILFVCPGWESSKGTLAEIERAEVLNIPIIFSLTDIMIYRRE